MAGQQSAVPSGHRYQIPSQARGTNDKRTLSLPAQTLFSSIVVSMAIDMTDSVLDMESRNAQAFTPPGRE